MALYGGRKECVRSYVYIQCEAGMSVIDAVMTQLSDLRSDEEFTKCINTADSMLHEEDQPHKRKRQKSVNLTDYVITEKIGQFQNNESNLDLKRLFFDVVDNVVAEMQLRFVRNSSLYNALSTAIVSSPNFLCKELGKLHFIKKFLRNVRKLSIISIQV